MQIVLNHKCYDSFCSSSLRELYLYLVSLLDEAIMYNNSKIEEVFEKMNTTELLVFYDSVLDIFDLETKELFDKETSLYSLHNMSRSNSIRNIIQQMSFSFWWLYFAKITKSKVGFLHTILLKTLPPVMNIKQYDINELKELADVDKHLCASL